MELKREKAMLSLLERQKAAIKMLKERAERWLEDEEVEAELRRERAEGREEGWEERAERRRLKCLVSE